MFRSSVLFIHLARLLITSHGLEHQCFGGNVVYGFDTTGWMGCCRPGTAGSGNLDQIPVGIGLGFVSAKVSPGWCSCSVSGFRADMADATGPHISVGYLGLLCRQWSVSMVAGMSQRQTELEKMRHDCKQRFRSARTGCCSYWYKY